MTSRGIKVFVVAVALSALAVTGCSSSKKHQTPITGTVPPTTTATPTTAATSGSTTTVAGTMSGMSSSTTMAK